ncbi:MAG: PaaI family thioesterase [Gordonia paraffinivorans]
MKTTFVVPDDLEPPRRDPAAPAVGDVIPPHNRRCHGCGPDAENGLHLRATVGENVTATARLVVEPRFEGGPGVIHGGIVATVFDEMMGLANMQLGVTAVTVVLDVDYALPIPIGTTLRLTARVLGRQRRKIYSAVEAFDDAAGPDAEPLAAGHGIFVVIDPRAHFSAARP